MFFQIVLCHWSTRHTTDSWHLGRWSNDTKWYVSIRAFTWILRNIEKYLHKQSIHMYKQNLSTHQGDFSIPNLVTLEDLFLFLIINKVNFEAMVPPLGAAPPAAHLNLKELDWNKARRAGGLACYNQHHIQQGLQQKVGREDAFLSKEYSMGKENRWKIKRKISIWSSRFKMFDYFLLSCCLPPALSLQLGSKKRDVYQRCDKCDTVYTCKFWDYLAPLGLAPST